eukprot:gene11728-24597_t
MSGTGLDELTQLVKDLKKARADEDNDRLHDVLVALESFEMIIRYLKDTQVAKVVGKLRKYSDDRVSQKAASLVDAWKKIANHGSKSPVTSTEGNSENITQSVEINKIPLRDFLTSQPILSPLSSFRYPYNETSKCASKRIKVLSTGDASKTGPVVYWMSRDQRISDNWALIRAQEVAMAKATALVIVFCLSPTYLGGCIRQRGFMMRNLKLIENDAELLHIPFTLLSGHPKDTLPNFCQVNNISTIICDFSPLRISKEWKNDISNELKDEVNIEVVDSHNIAPCWDVSPKCEFSAKTIRSKIHMAVDTYLKEYPPILPHPHIWPTRPIGGLEGPNRWLTALDSTEMDYTVPEIDWLDPGERAANIALISFFKRLKSYGTDRNNPILRNGVSNLSPYIRYGHISVQRILLEVKRALNVSNKSLFPDGERTSGTHAFCEEVVVRRELSDNFCYYNDKYDVIEGAHSWAQTTLQEHWNDVRTVVYTQSQLENAQTHDDLWNAAQLEMMNRGKMHGFMRMYWAKK